MLGCFGLIALGTGGIKPNIANFGADQIGDETEKQRESQKTFFSLFYLSINIGVLNLSFVRIKRGKGTNSFFFGHVFFLKKRSGEGEEVMLLDPMTEDCIWFLDQHHDWWIAWSYSYGGWIFLYLWCGCSLYGFCCNLAMS